jgi:hypothetical protein
MSNPTLPNTPPQFRTAEYAGGAGGDRCKACKQSITDNYYRVNGAMACPVCAERVKRSIPPDSQAAFTRGLLFGVGGAILGLILYAAFGIITGWMIGYVSLAVGYIVGKAIKMGSGGIGGRRYQIAAVVLTYAAVSIAAVPIWIASANKMHKSAPTEQAQTRQAPADQGTADVATAPNQKPAAAKPRISPGAAVALLVLLGLASPLLALQSPLQGLIGLVILFVGIRIAWQIAAGARIQILGPFKLAPKAPEHAPAG